ncbi:MAG TPA: hypothetical protein VL614_19530, partial [Acetobacteraceae bacterium]|nr:hypothetical protein [Acetobacteraceae bacterium]
LQRIIFVSGYYGVKQGLLSVPRLLWGNLVNFLANWRAIRQIIKTGDPRRVAWDKTTHDFPSIGGENRVKRSLDELLVESGVVSATQMSEAREHRIDGLQIGSSLIHEGLISAEQLAHPMAEQIGVPCESVNIADIPQELIDSIPANVALHYAVLPLRAEGGTLVLASESYIDPVSLAAIARQLQRRVRYVLAHKGQVIVGLRCCYAHLRDEDAHRSLLLEVASQCLCAGNHRWSRLWNSYVSGQVMLGEILVAQGHLDEVAFRALLLSHSRSGQPLGEFLVGQGVITQETLERALLLQASLQPTMLGLLAKDAWASLSRETPAERAA